MSGNDRGRPSDEPSDVPSELRRDGATEVRDGMSSEVKLFARMATFGLVVGVVYWFLTHEPAGAVMLTTFGLASGIAAVAVFVGSRGRRKAETAAADGPVGVTLEGAAEPVPSPGWAPIGIALGLAGVALAAAFGPWLAIAGIFLAARSAKVWLDTAVDESDRAWNLRPPRVPEENEG